MVLSYKFMNARNSTFTTLVAANRNGSTQTDDLYFYTDGILLKRGGNMKLNNEGTVNKFIRHYDCDQMYTLQQKDDTALEYEDSPF